MPFSAVAVEFSKFPFERSAAIHYASTGKAPSPQITFTAKHSEPKMILPVVLPKEIYFFPTA